jgi:hypothetical protein
MIFGGVGALAVLVVCVLTVFAGQLARARRAGFSEYGVLAPAVCQRIRHEVAPWRWDPAEPLVGSADFQYVADLGNGFEVIQTMGREPITTFSDRRDSLVRPTLRRHALGQKTSS